MMRPSVQLGSSLLVCVLFRLIPTPRTELTSRIPHSSGLDFAQCQRQRHHRPARQLPPIGVSDSNYHHVHRDLRLPAQDHDFHDLRAHQQHARPATDQPLLVHLQPSLVRSDVLHAYHSQL